MYYIITRLPLLVLVIALLDGCQTLTEKVEKQKKADALQSTLDSYRRAIRWGYFDQAYNFVKYEKGEYPDPPETLTELRVTDYEVLHAPTMLEENIAVQLVKITYYYVAYQTLKSLRDRQVWVHDETAKRWYLDSPIPEFK